METFILFTIIIISAFAIVILNRKKLNKQFSDPQKVLKSIEINLSSNYIPNYIAIHNLKKSIELNPDHPELISKLKELESNNVSSSPKTLYAVLSTLIGLMGIMPFIFWSTGKINLYGLVLGIIFILFAFIIYLQYLKEK